MQQEIICRFCKANISSDFFFCPNCGKKLKDKPLSTSTPKQILVYLASAFLPPIGLWWAVKYLRQSDPLSKKIAVFIIIITVIATAVTFKIFIDTMNTVNQTVSKQLQMYQNF